MDAPDTRDRAHWAAIGDAGRSERRSRQHVGSKQRTHVPSHLAKGGAAAVADNPYTDKREAFAGSRRQNASERHMAPPANDYNVPK